MFGGGKLIDYTHFDVEEHRKNKTLSGDELLDAQLYNATTPEGVAFVLALRKKLMKKGKGQIFQSLQAFNAPGVTLADRRAIVERLKSLPARSAENPRGLTLAQREAREAVYAIMAAVDPDIRTALPAPDVNYANVEKEQGIPLRDRAGNFYQNVINPALAHPAAALVAAAVGVKAVGGAMGYDQAWIAVPEMSAVYVATMTAARGAQKFLFGEDGREWGRKTAKSLVVANGLLFSGLYGMNTAYQFGWLTTDSFPIRAYNDLSAKFGFKGAFKADVPDPYKATTIGAVEVISAAVNAFNSRDFDKTPVGMLRKGAYFCATHVGYSVDIRSLDGKKLTFGSASYDQVYAVNQNNFRNSDNADAVAACLKVMKSAVTKPPAAALVPVVPPVQADPPTGKPRQILPYKLPEIRVAPLPDDEPLRPAPDIHASFVQPWTAKPV